MNNNGTSCVDFEARFCCPKKLFDATTDYPNHNVPVSFSTNAYGETTSLFTYEKFESTTSVDKYYTTLPDITTESYIFERWSFEDFGLSEPESLEELRNLLKISKISDISLDFSRNLLEIKIC